MSNPNHDPKDGKFTSGNGGGNRNIAKKIAKQHYETMSREEAGPLIQSKKLTPAGLYEPDHAPKGTKFVHVQLAPGMTRFYRVR